MYVHEILRSAQDDKGEEKRMTRGRKKHEGRITRPSCQHQKLTDDKIHQSKKFIIQLFVFQVGQVRIVVFVLVQVGQVGKIIFLLVQIVVEVFVGLAGM